MPRIGDRRGAVIKRSTLPPFVGILAVVLATLLACIVLLLDTSTSLLSSRDEGDSSSSSPLLSLAQQPTMEQNQQRQHHQEQPITIAYAISLIKCGDFQSSTVGMSDAAMVLRHSIHQTSIRNNNKNNNKVSKYDYKMYAIVHRQAADCAQQPLVDAGFEVLIRDPPVVKKDIKGKFLRKHIQREWCCGADEFVKLYAYTIDSHPIVVHVDVDFVFHKPMDDLFDAMLLDAKSQEGIAARKRIPLERPNDPWPDQVDAFMTRDWGQVMPGRKALFQAGFLVIKPSQQVFNTIVDVIKEGNYVEGFARENGWGGKGYGGLVGSMAAQGVIAYVYDILLPHTWMELNQCRFNHMGMDVLFRSMPSFRPNHKKVGQCRNDLDYCEDCMHTPVEQIYNIHYTQCRKPWNCIGVGDKEKDATKASIPENSVHLDHCMELLTIWHNYRTDLETKLEGLTGDTTVRNGRAGNYKKDVFQGHCTENGQTGYLQLSAKPDTFKRLPELYN